MQNLFYNTEKNSVSLINNNLVLAAYENVTSVSGNELGYYEVRAKKGVNNSSVIVLRVPIANTNMKFIQE